LCQSAWPFFSKIERSVRGGWFTVTWLFVANCVDVSARDGPLFTDITASAGLVFEHDPLPADGAFEFRLPEIMGSGGAFLDFDGDGDLDIYLVQATPVEPNRLYRQEEDGHFEDVTEASGLGDRGYGMGVAVGDVDNDGRVDVYVTNYGRDALYHNRGGGRFEKTEMASESWSTSAVFCDFDADGYLDLYVTSYVKYDAGKSCFKHDGSADFCGPQEFPGEADRLYRNDGNGNFTDVSRSSRIASMRAPGLGVVCLDLNADGRLDFYVANDGKANQLWIQQDDGTFVDDAYMLGAALNAFGKEEAGMGIAPGDVDNDGDIDLFLTHLRNETNTLYRNDGELGFEDATHHMGFGKTGIDRTGFGVAMLDFDHDGHLDLAVAHGRVAWGPPLEGSPSNPSFGPYAEPNVLLRNVGGAQFERVAGELDTAIEISRGLVTGDVDGDGDLDVLVTNTAGPARLFRNDASKIGRWLLVRALSDLAERDAHGALVTVSVGGRLFTRLAQPGGSYLSSGDPRAHFGLPAEGVVEALTVVWPDGEAESFSVDGLNRVIVVRKGEGQ